MTRHEREEFGPETRDVIEGLRRLALDAEPPVDLLARVKQGRGRSLLDQCDASGRWRRLLPQRSWRPAVWGLAVAVLCFMAGVFVPPPDFTPWRQEATSKPSAPAPRPQSKADGTRRLTAHVVAARSPSRLASSAQITITLSPALYEQLLREAQRRQEGLSTLLHEAVVTYIHSDRTE